MDDSLLAEFHAVFSVSGEANDPRAPHPHYALYKQRREGYGDQEERRKQLLERQRLRRRDFADYVRRIAEGEMWEEMEEEDHDEVDMGTLKVGEHGCTLPDHTPSFAQSNTTPGGEKRSRKRRIHPWRNQLMLSEWLVGRPEDFEQDWLMLVCPVGRRSLVVASRKTTSAYSRSGQCLNNFPSLLPGGSRNTHRTAEDFCILDCIHHDSTRTYYVLDIMCWRGHPVYDCETDFRMFWLQTKLAEEGERVSSHSRINPLRFIPLDSFPCSSASIATALGSTWPLEVDGLLFLHRKAHYTIGRSPLALWLKPHMVADLLSVPVSQDFLACSPRLSEIEMDASLEPASAAVGDREEVEGEVAGCTT